MFRRLAAVFLSTCLFAAMFAFGASADGNVADSDRFDSDFVENKFIKCAENDRFELYVIGLGEKTGEFYINDKSENTRYYSNPQNISLSSESDSERSQFLITLYTKSISSSRVINSYTGSGKGKNIAVDFTDSGYNAVYKINNAIKFTLKIRLTDDGFSAAADFSDINRMKDNVVTDVEFLPYFGASRLGEEGYMLVPDGCGALIYNNTDKPNASAYSQKVYGEDLAFAGNSASPVKAQAYLSVFGCKTASGGFAVSLDDGAANAYINAESAISEESYNRVYSSFEIIGHDRISIGEGDSEIVAGTDTYSTENPLTKSVKLSYMFISHDEGYSEMAELYRDHLGLKAENASKVPSVFLELYGGLSRKESVFGIPLTVFKKLTTAGDAKEIVSWIGSRVDGEVVAIYRNADSSVISGKIQDKFRIKNSLGGLSKLNKLKEACNGNLYMENNIFSAKKGGHGFSTFGDTVSRINRNIVMKDQYDLSTLTKSTELPSSYAIKSTKLKKIYGKYFKSLEKKDFESAFVNLACTAYSDFDSNAYISREETIECFNELLSKYGKNGVIYSPNSYALDNGKYIADTPTFSSCFDITDSQVPFYQLVISGTKEYATQSVNLNSDINLSFLKAIESGASLKFTFVYRNITAIKNTEYGYLYGADFINRKDEAVDYQQRLEKAYSKLGSRVLKKHKILSDGVSLSEFENGSKAVINFTGVTVNTDYGKVEAENFIIVGSDEVNE